MYLLIQDQVRITDQAPNQKREGEIWAWGGLGGGAGPEGPPTEGAGQAPPLTGCLRPFHRLLIVTRIYTVTGRVITSLLQHEGVTRNSSRSLTRAPRGLVSFRGIGSGFKDDSLLRPRRVCASWLPGQRRDARQGTARRSTAPPRAALAVFQRHEPPAGHHDGPCELLRWLGALAARATTLEKLWLR
jgi:hypothetical protein